MLLVLWVVVPSFVREFVWGCEVLVVALAAPQQEPARVTVPGGSEAR